jgi:hypothetical protein
MSRIYIGPGSWISLGVGIAVIVFLIGGSAALSTAVVHADPVQACTLTGTTTPPCDIGNLEVLSFNTFSGNACPNMGITGTGSILNNAQGAGFAEAESAPCTLAASSGATTTQSATIEVEGINGFLIEDISGSADCGVTTGGSVSLTLNPGLSGVSALVLSCPTLASGAHSTVSGDISFTPTSGPVTETYTLAGSFSSAGSLTLNGFSDQFSLTPEPNTLVLFGSGFVLLAGIARRRLRHD